LSVTFTGDREVVILPKQNIAPPEGTPNSFKEHSMITLTTSRIERTGANTRGNIPHPRHQVLHLTGTRLVFGLALACTLGLAAMPAWAQTSSGGEADQESGILEEVLVTARHREESLQQVPLSISAIGGDAIKEARITTMQDLQHSVPNLVFGETGSSGETHIGIRGIGDFSRNIGFDTRVGVYVDGVFAGQSRLKSFAGRRGHYLARTAPPGSSISSAINRLLVKPVVRPA
jgi:hypothetical protein